MLGALESVMLSTQKDMAHTLLRTLAAGTVHSERHGSHTVDQWLCLCISGAAYWIVFFLLSLVLKTTVTSLYNTVVYGSGYQIELNII